MLTVLLPLLRFTSVKLVLSALVVDAALATRLAVSTITMTSEITVKVLLFTRIRLSSLHIASNNSGC